jgi:hypothetical protein
MLTTFKKDYFIKIDYFHLKILQIYTVLTLFKKSYKSSLIIFLEDFQFR